MAIKKTIDIDVNTKNAQKNVDDLGNSIDKTSKKAKGSLDGVTNAADNFTGGLITKGKNLIGTLGGVAKGFKGIGVAIAASGIGLLVTVIASVVAAFKSSEEGQNKFAKLMGVIGSVVGNLMDVLSDFGEVVIDSIENPQKAWEDFKTALETGYEFIKGQVIDRFKANWTILTKGVEAGILSMRIKWNEFTGDAEEAEQLKTELKEVQTEIEKSVDVINKRNQEIVNGFNAAIDKVKEFAAEVEADAKRAAEIANIRAAADKQERDLLVARARASRDVADLRAKAVEKEKYDVGERIKFLEQAATIEENITNREIALAQARYNAKVAENSLSKSTKEDLKEEAQLKAEVIQLETKRLNLQRSLNSQISAFQKEAEAQREAEKKAKEEQLKKEQEDELKRLESIQAIRDEFKQKIEDAEAESEIEKLELEEERKIAELEALEASEQQKAEVVAYYQKMRTEAEKEEAKKREEIALQEKEYKNDVLNAEADLLGQFSNILKQLGEKNKTLAIAGIIAEQVASVAKIISNTGVANAKAAAALPLTGGMPFVAINSIAAGLGIANSVLSAKKAISQLGGGASPDSSGEISANNSSSAPNAPSFNIVGDTGINQIAQSLNNQNNNPVKAYVVGKDVSTQQELDRNIQATASF
ncbi:hypothetical protein [Galbibacter pacificus]|uniref:Uncharacterized protein n=1 Tax=Galbibacter pacificus TaxID=2996052 RepID=A0ABT6FQE3_9FLAO|nr:hypothetical protein [Galbibacter pacificus]MDG3582048.1 hypothetical protein [Galbibacter pacificus]MDG3585478.1 hypothetical protein [Galbibacter pacificus]